MNALPYIPAALLILFAVGCGGIQTPIDLEPESLEIEFDSSTPITVSCVRGERCESDTLGEASLDFMGEGLIRIGDAIVPATTTVETYTSVQPGPDGPITEVRAQVCIDSPLLGSLYVLWPELPDPLCVDVER